MATKSNPKESKKRTSRFSDMLLQVTTDLAKTKSLDEALKTWFRLPPQRSEQKEEQSFLMIRELVNYIPESPKVTSVEKSES